jgi:hypothetical protein
MKTHKKQLSIDDCKTLLYYGETRDKSIVLKAGEGHLDLCLDVMFECLDYNNFDRMRAENLFWTRIRALANEYYKSDENSQLK